MSSRANDDPPRLAALPPPPPRPDPTEDAADRWYRQFLAERTKGHDAATALIVSAKALGDRDATIAALQARQRALADLCWSGWVVALTLGALLVVRMIGGM